MRFTRLKPSARVGNRALSFENGTPLGTATRPLALFVLGMGRSGTSAITRVLSLCGVALPTGLRGADPANPRGYWEPRASLLLNRTIQERHGSIGCDPSLRLLEEGVLSAKAKSAYIAKITAFLKRLPAAPVVVIKDLNIVVLSELWFRAAQVAGFNIAVVIALRHPQEVIASNVAVAQLSPELTSALWLKSNLLAERCTRTLPRVFVDYANFLADWRREITRISKALAIDLSSRDEGAIEHFLTPDLHRQRYSGPVVDRFGTNWISTVYEALSAAARDQDWDESALDCIFDAYRASEHDFRTAFDNCRDIAQSLRFRIQRPSILKPILELIALAHRRSGTWA